MSEDEILAMGAGRGIDALIAEKVMGWRAGDEKNTISDEPEIWHITDDDGNCWRGEPFKVYDGYDHMFYHWSPSTDISTAWQVMEHIEAEGIARLELTRLGWPVPGVWRATLFTTAISAGYTANAPTAPLAICRAALLAVMEAES